MSNGFKGRAWSVVLAGTGINLALGILYTWSVFKGAIAKEGSGFNWSPDALNDPYALCCLVFAFAMILAGRVQDRFGPRITALVGGLLVGVGFVLTYFSTAYAVWLIGFGVLAGIGIGFGYSAATPPGLKWFPARKTGMVAGIVVSGFGLASVYIAPLSKYLIGIWGIQEAMLFFGLAFALVVSLLSLVLRNPPTDYDATAVFGDGTAPGQAARPAAPPHDVRPLQALKTRRFWLLWTMYAIGAGAGLMVIGSVAGMAKASLGELAFLAVAVLAVGNAAGRIAAGILSDRFGRRWTLFSMLLFQAVLMGIAVPIVGADTKEAFLLVVLVLLIGFNYGTNLSLFPAFAKDHWGLKHFGSNYGLLFAAWGVGGLVLPRLSQMLVADAGGVNGKYTSSFLMAGLLLLVAAALTFGLREKGGKPVEANKKETSPRLGQLPIGSGFRTPQ